MVEQSRLDEMLAEASVDRYDEYEYFWGMFCTLAMRLSFPLEARALGEPGTVVGLDSERSGLRGASAKIIKRTPLRFRR